MKWRAKLIPQSTPKGAPCADGEPAIYGDMMTRKAFDLWRANCDDDESRRLGAPAFIRTLIPVDDDGKEIPEFSPAWWAAMFEADPVEAS